MTTYLSGTRFEHVPCLSRNRLDKSQVAQQNEPVPLDAE